MSRRLSIVNGEVTETVDAAFFGTGADGALTFDGTTTILGLVPAANVYTMVTDIFATTLVVNTGVTIKTGSCRIFASVSVTTNGTGTIKNDGLPGGVLAGGATTPLSAYTSSAAGVAGRATVGVGTAGNASPNAIGGAGGAGGADVAQAGGAGGTKIAPAVQFSKPYWFPSNQQMWTRAGTSNTIQYFGCGAAGGSGGNATGAAANSGSGGSGGGHIGIFAPTITNNGTISAIGGAGSNATGTTSGGGGGGGGGVISLMYHTYTNNGTVTVAGGALGNGVGAGSNGVAGNSGTIIQLAL